MFPPYVSDVLCCTVVSLLPQNCSIRVRNWNPHVGARLRLYFYAAPSSSVLTIKFQLQGGYTIQKPKHIDGNDWDGVMDVPQNVVVSISIDSLFRYYDCFIHFRHTSTVPTALSQKYRHRKFMCSQIDIICAHIIGQSYEQRRLNGLALLNVDKHVFVSTLTLVTRWVFTKKPNRIKWQEKWLV